MTFNLNSSPNYVSNSNRKRAFLVIILLNSVCGSFYYIHERKNTFDNQEKNHQHTNTTTNSKPIQFIKNILEKEYEYNDLINFYNHVQKEYSLGLKCTRMKTTSATIVKLNISDRSEKITKKTTRLHFRHFQRTDLLTFIIANADACLDDDVDLVIIIISKSDNYKTRDAIRRTWASGKSLGIYAAINVKYFFLIDFNENLNHNIRLESNIFRDIIQVELPQQYTLVTQRVLAVFEWSFHYCRTAKYLFKTDDDIFVNLILLLEFISPLIRQTMNNSFLISDMNMYGYQHINAYVYRQTIDPVGIRYIVTHDEYPCESYPTFLSGFGYLISKKARDAILYAAYHDAEPFRISDVYFTGIIPDYLSIPRQSLSNYNIRFSGDCDGFFNQSTAFACADSSHHGNISDVFTNFNQYWQLIKQNHRSIYF